MSTTELITKLLFLGWTDEQLLDSGYTSEEIEDAKRYGEGDLQYGY